MTAILDASLRRDGERAYLTKIHGPDFSLPFDDVKTFDIDNIEFGSFDDMAGLLQCIEHDPHRALIRGNAIMPGKAQSRLLRDHSDGRKATIEPVADGLQWIMLDVDSVPAPATLADTNEARLAFLRGYLPEAFRDATCFYQWSSSAGVKGWETMSAHFFFWLDRKHLCTNLHKRCSKIGDWHNLVDPAPFTPNQIHYTARPVFVDRVDPIADARSGVLRGSTEAVELAPWIAPYVPRPVVSARFKEALKPGASFTEHLTEIGNPHYHLPILRAIAHYVAITPAMRRDKGECLEAVRYRALGAGRSYLDNNYYDRVYDEAEAKYGLK